MGIGALLADGIGDTIRVSLSEPPEAEIPVAYKLASYVIGTRSGSTTSGCALLDGVRLASSRAPCHLCRGQHRRKTSPGGGFLSSRPRTAPPTAPADREARPDYTYYGVQLPEHWRQHTDAAIVDAPAWNGEEGTYPAFAPQYLMFVAGNPAPIKFLFLSYVQLNEEVKACLRAHPNGGHCAIEPPEPHG